jgi:hypothetical protein
MGKRSERKPGTKTLKTSVVFEVGLWERLRLQSARERRPAQDIIGDAVNAYLKHKEARRQR